MFCRGRCRWMLAVVVLALGAAPAVAQADSLVYIKGQQVWISQPNGSQARPVTPRSPYWQWPSQSNYGTIVVSGGAPSGQATGNDKIFAFNQQGRSLLAKPLDTPGSVTLSGCGATYTTHFAVSPNGQTVAYQAAGACMPGASGADTFTQPLNGSKSWSQVNPEDYVNPVWVVDSEHLFVTHNGPTVTYNQGNYGLVDLSGQHQPTGWTDNSNIPDGYQYSVFPSRNGKVYAIFLDDASNYIPPQPHHVRIHLETFSTPVSGNSSDACTITLNPAKFTAAGFPLIETLTFSSDNRTLMWSENDGIWAADVSNPHSCGAPHLLIPGGLMPYLSPAALSAKIIPAPNTAITGVSVNHRARKATITFRGSGGVGKLHFRCRLDGGRWVKCTSPVLATNLRRGRNTFSVAAIDGRGKVDPTPATRQINV